VTNPSNETILSDIDYHYDSHKSENTLQNHVETTRYSNDQLRYKQDTSDPMVNCCEIHHIRLMTGYKSAKDALWKR
jgi:hypothetical protein